MRAQAPHEPIASIGDLASELDELGRQVGVLRDVPRGPVVAGIGIVIDQGRAFAGDVRELTQLCQLAHLLFDPALDAPQPRCRALVHGRQYQARRSVTMPSGPTATAVGTSATPYLRASSGRRDTSTVTTSRPAATRSRSSVWQSVHRGCVN